jgi:hypothetical protein
MLCILFLRFNKPSWFNIVNDTKSNESKETFNKYNNFYKKYKLKSTKEEEQEKENEEKPQKPIFQLKDKKDIIPIKVDEYYDGVKHENNITSNTDKYVEDNLNTLIYRLGKDDRRLRNMHINSFINKYNPKKDY